MEAPVAEVSTAALEEANALAASFEAAAAAAADFPAGKLSSEQKLHLYGLFKQATVGPAPLAPTTSALDIVGRMKHQAWSGMRDLTRAAAMAKYGSYVESLQARDRRALALSVRFLQVRYTQSTSKRGNEAYAVYEIDCREGSHSWRCIVRWSDLARLWDALQLFHLSEMKLAQSSLPTFYRHTVTTSKVDRTLCEQRAQTMQQLLRGMARVWDVSVLEERGPSTFRHFLSSGSDVEKRTPESAWYTAAGGWPTAMVQAAARKLAPRSLVPHAGEAPALHPPLASAIGEVRIEVLEAVGLLQADLLSPNDVYAVLVLESYAVQTVCLEDTSHPRWRAEDARAARLPVFSPFASLCVALFDADFSTLDADDPLGRVEIRLATLHPNTVYTSWLPLHLCPDSAEDALAAHLLGHVRVRYSVTWTSAASRLVGYWGRMPPLGHPPVLPLSEPADEARMQFTYFGLASARRYSWSTFQSYLDEMLSLREPLDVLARDVRDLITYRQPLSSLTALIMWQYFCSHAALVLSLLPGALLWALGKAYCDARDSSAELHRPPSLWESWRWLLLLGRPPSLSYTPPLATEDAMVANPDADGGATTTWADAAADRGAHDGSISRDVASPRALLRSVTGGVAGAVVGTASAVANAAASTASAVGGAVGGAAMSTARAVGSNFDRGRQRAPLAEVVEQQYQRERRVRADARRRGRTMAGARMGDNDVEAASLAGAVEMDGGIEGNLGGMARHPPRRALLRSVTGLAGVTVKGVTEVVAALGEAAASTASAVESAATSTARAVVQEGTINPLAVYLGPVQRDLAELLVYVRALRSIGRWDDPVLTGWLCVALMFSALVLPWVPWRLLLRLLGLALLGPHQYFFERERQKQAGEQAALERHSAGH